MMGILLINKPTGYTSRDIVNIISKKFKTRRVGHTGTLDPGATGLLVICINKALKVCELLTNHDKEYIAGITLGIETDTLDMDGVVLSTETVDIDKQKIIECVNSFKKTYLQEVPKYSAIKVNGKKLYEYARSNTYVELPKKEVTIYDIQIIDDILYKDGKVYFKIKCHVSKGTYIRSLVRDIGAKLGVVATMNSLERTKLGTFILSEAYTLEDIMNDSYKLLSIEEALPDISHLVVDDEVAFKVKNGVAINRFVDTEMKFIFDKDNNLLALYKNDNDKARVYKMF